MPRQSISLTPPNDAWLKAQVESEEFASKSEVVNDLIRKVREIYVKSESLSSCSTGRQRIRLIDETDGAGTVVHTGRWRRGAAPAIQRVP